MTIEHVVSFKDERGATGQRNQAGSSLVAKALLPYSAAGNENTIAMFAFQELLLVLLAIIFVVAGGIPRIIDL